MRHGYGGHRLRAPAPPGGESADGDRDVAVGVARAPPPGGSRIGDVTSARIVRGGPARIEPGRIPSRWARTVRGGVDRVALGSHYASLPRPRPRDSVERTRNYASPPRPAPFRGRGPAAPVRESGRPAGADAGRARGPGGAPARRDPAVRKPASRSCAASAFPAWRSPGFRRDPARGALTGARGRGAPGSPATVRKTDSNERTDAGTRIRTGTAARATTGPRSAGSPPTPGWRGRDRGSAGRGSGDADVAVAVDRLPPGWGRPGGARRTRDAVNRLPRERERALGGGRLRYCAADFPGGGDPRRARTRRASEPSSPRAPARNSKTVPVR